MALDTGLWPGLRDKAKAGELQFDAKNALASARACLDLVDDLLGMSQAVSNLGMNNVPPIGSLTSGRELAKVYNEKATRLATILKDHATIVGDMGDTYVAAGKAYAKAESDNSGLFEQLDPIRMPTQGLPYQPPTLPEGALGPTDNTELISRSPDFLSVYGGNKDTAVAAHVFPPDGDQLSWSDLYQLGQTLDPKPEIAAAHNWLSMMRDLSNRFLNFYTAIESSVESWRGHGAQSARKATAEYVSSIVPTIESMAAMGANLYFAADWMHNTREHMPTTPAPDPMLANISLFGTNAASSLLAFHRMAYNSNYRDGMKTSASVIPAFDGPLNAPPAPAPGGGNGNPGSTVGGRVADLLGQLFRGGPHDQGQSQNPGPGQSQNPGPGQSQNPGPGQSQNPGPGQNQNPGPGQNQNPGPGQGRAPDQGQPGPGSHSGAPGDPGSAGNNAPGNEHPTGAGYHAGYQRGYATGFQEGSGVTGQGSSGAGIPSAGDTGAGANTAAQPHIAPVGGALPGVPGTGSVGRPGPGRGSGSPSGAGSPLQGGAQDHGNGSGAPTSDVPEIPPSSTPIAASSPPSLTSAAPSSESSAQIPMPHGAGSAADAGSPSVDGAGPLSTGYGTEVPAIGGERRAVEYPATQMPPESLSPAAERAFSALSEQVTRFPEAPSPSLLDSAPTPGASGGAPASLGEALAQLTHTAQDQIQRVLQDLPTALNQDTLSQLAGVPTAEVQRVLENLPNLIDENTLSQLTGLSPDLIERVLENAPHALDHGSLAANLSQATDPQNVLNTLTSVGRNAVDQLLEQVTNGLRAFAQFGGALPGADHMQDLLGRLASAHIDPTQPLPEPTPGGGDMGGGSGGGVGGSGGGGLANPAASQLSEPRALQLFPRAVLPDPPPVQSAAGDSVPRGVSQQGSSPYTPVPGAPMAGAPMAGGGQAGGGAQHKIPRFLQSLTHLDEGIGELPLGTIPVIEPIDSDPDGSPAGDNPLDQIARRARGL